jgi:thymidylate synthase (FAD)
MKLIKPSFEIVDIQPTPRAIPDDMEIGPKMIREELLKVAYRQIELAGRTCYKSEDKITDTSAKEFVDRMIASGHNAMLEFGTIYLHFPSDCDRSLYHRVENYKNNPYSQIRYAFDKNKHPIHGDTSYYITTNLRVLVENDWLEDLKYICEPNQYHEKRIHVKFTTDRGVSHELVRHRVFSFAQESTRYCNYSKDKFGNELTFILPSWYSDKEPTSNGIFIANNNAEIVLQTSLNESEHNYLGLLDSGWTPQQARQVLPNALKTEINMCGFTSDWKKFFELRDNPKAHPDMQALVAPLHKEFKDKEYA